MKRAIFFTASGLLALTVLAQPLLKPLPAPVVPPRKPDGLKPVPPRPLSSNTRSTLTSKVDSKADQLQLIRGNGMLGQFLGL